MSDAEFTATLRELADVVTELSSVPVDQHDRRLALRDRENALRGRLRAFRDTWTDHLSIDQLKRKIAEVETRLADHYGNRLSHTAGGQSGFGGGLDPTVLHRMHRAMDASADLPAMKAELARLRDRLAKLEGK